MDELANTTVAPDAATTGPAPAPRNPLPDLEALVERWWDEHFPGSPVARVTEAWNHALAAKDELKHRLKELIGAVAQS